MATKRKQPPHELAAVVDLFLDFIGLIDDEKRRKDFGFWCKKARGVTFGQALDILKELESLPIQYNKAGTLVNKLKKWKKK